METLFAPAEEARKLLFFKTPATAAGWRPRGKERRPLKRAIALRPEMAGTRVAEAHHQAGNFRKEFPL